MPYDGKIPKSIKECIFALALTISMMLAFELFDLEKVGQCHRVQHVNLCHSATIKIYNCHLLHFFIFAKIFVQGSNIHIERHKEKQTNP